MQRRHGYHCSHKWTVDFTLERAARAFAAHLETLPAPHTVEHKPEEPRPWRVTLLPTP